MSSFKRKRDPEYSYDEPGDPSGQQQNPQNGGDMATHSRQIPGPWQGNNNHVQNLLAQARMDGLLQPGLLPPNGFGAPPESVMPQIMVGFPPSSHAHAQDRVPEGRNLLQYPQHRTQRPPTVDGTRYRSDIKRRRLDTNKSSPKKQQQKPQRPKKSQPIARKPGTKLPGILAVDDKVVESLVAEALSTPSGPHAPGAHVLPTFLSIPKPENYPPPLPKINDKGLEQQSFTHPSYSHDPLNKEQSALHYERLEFLGDSFMNYCVTKILYSRFPGLREGELTRFRSQIISNDNIRHYAMMYGFHERLRLSGTVEKDAREMGKKIADVFEAYIGGILTDQPEMGERVVFEWMQDITAPQIDEADKIVKMLSNVNKNAKQDLYVLMDAEKVPAPVYVVTKIGSTNSDFEVTCLIQGKEMGRGIGKNKSDAGARAAMQVLERLEASSRKGVATEKAGEPEDGECQE